MTTPDPTARPERRRVLNWTVASIVVAVLCTAAAALVVMTRDDSDGRPRSAPCEAVLHATDQFVRGERTEDSLLQVVREQVPVARADAARDPRLQAVSDAIVAVRDNLEAGRRFREVVVLYNTCG